MQAAPDPVWKFATKIDRKIVLNLAPPRGVAPPEVAVRIRRAAMRFSRLVFSFAERFYIKIGATDADSHPKKSRSFLLQKNRVIKPSRKNSPGKRPRPINPVRRPMMCCERRSERPRRIQRRSRKRTANDHAHRNCHAHADST